MFPSRLWSLSPTDSLPGFKAKALAVWLSLVSFSPPSPSRALPPQLMSPEAAPQCISGRTSYLRVRLAYHLYPQLIPPLCHVDGFGPPPRCYRGFTLAMGSSPGFGSNPRDSFALLRLAFASAPFVHEVNLAAEINSPAHSSIGTPSPR